MSNKINKDLKALGLIAGTKKTNQMIKLGIIGIILMTALFLTVGVNG